MKINTLLENIYPTSDIQFSDLSPEQVGVLVKLAKGEIDIDSANDQQFDIMQELRGIRLLDDDWNLSREGSAAARYAEERGGSQDLIDARERAERGPVQVDIDDEADLDIDGHDVTIDDEDEEFDFNL